MNHVDERTMNGRPPESYLRQSESAWRISIGEPRCYQ